MVLAALALFGWGAGCWYASGAYTQLISKRLGYGLILTMGIGLVLAPLGILYGPTCWGLLILAIVLSLAARRRRKRGPICEREVYWPYVAIVAAVAFIAWPAIVRPPTDGDTLIYHLPLAASWAHAHSFWNTDTQYWWYPGGSEMLGAVLIASCGMFAVPFVGAIALLTLAITVYEATLAVCRNRFFASACSLALATSHVAAIQGGDLQNDAILAALVVSLTFQRLRASVSWPIAIALAITKPVGWVYSLATSTFTGKQRLSSGLIVVAAIAMWWLRNAVLIRSAIDPIPSRPDRDLFTTSIFAHGINGFATLGQSALQDGWSTFLFIFIAFGSIVGARASGYARMAFVAAVIWIVSPYTFDSGGIAQLALGSALRFGLPAMALAAISFGQFVEFLEGRMAGALRVAALFLATLSAINLYRYDLIYRFTIAPTSCPGSQS